MTSFFASVSSNSKPASFIVHTLFKPLQNERKVYIVLFTLDFPLLNKTK
jgi:hypothetical protein